jgi:hypothetical protein
MEDVGILYDHFPNFKAIWSIFWSFGILFTFCYVAERKIWQPWIWLFIFDTLEFDKMTYTLTIKIVCFVATNLIWLCSYVRWRFFYLFLLQMMTAICVAALHNDVRRVVWTNPMSQRCVCKRKKNVANRFQLIFPSEDESNFFLKFLQIAKKWSRQPLAGWLKDIAIKSPKIYPQAIFFSKKCKTLTKGTFSPKIWPSSVIFQKKYPK